ncbi:hypothetical protein, partial [Synoicihabitans lomoniglobus]|uniref:hypothetical protein n=1 Tax=Synoicihabitans lomoniglobus TaxID=2909285 RepID=UPI002ED01F77|nr:hypothetical protein [Opitutaceae bacterium LMO-M01]
YIVNRRASRTSYPSLLTAPRSGFVHPAGRDNDGQGRRCPVTPPQRGHHFTFAGRRVSPITIGKMSPHYWIDVRSKRRLLVFTVATALIVGFWSVLPEEIRASLSHARGRWITNLPFFMFFGWIGGWFILLFVRGEDLHITAPFDFQGFTRLVAGALILASLASAGALFLVSEP